MSNDAFESIIGRLIGPSVDDAALPAYDPEPWLGVAEDPGPESATAGLTAAFLVALAGSAHPSFGRATALLDHPPSAAPTGLAALYRRGLTLIRDEVASRSRADAAFADRLASAAELLAATAAVDRMVGVSDDASDAAEALWSIFCPEAVGIRGHEAERERELRADRTMTISSLNPRPIVDPARELLLTSNVLLTLPPASRGVATLPYAADLRRDLERTAAEPQAHWYDHPIQIGVEPTANELLYGLTGLDEAIEAERRRDPTVGSVTCILSVSVTHPGLHRLARRYVEAELGASDPLRHLVVHVFTEDETDRLVDEVLAPAADRLLGVRASGSTAPGRPSPPAGPAAPDTGLREVFGVDGAYGRHYSFLKAIAALWHVVVTPEVRATFKIDLDQVFPQDVLVAETGQTAFEHLATPLWGAQGTDARGRAVALGMLAGALVNERDIGRGLFTPDVAYPMAALAPDQRVFISALPQALSTRAEMMERYDTPERDGVRAGLERIHVTGGTNGILVDALRRYRPFTPSFVGRAEDQAYLLSVLGGGPRADGRPGAGTTTRGDAGTDPGSAPARLAYAHAAGLIMRHDKEAFAGEAIATAEAGKLIGDDVRILQFSAYARVITGDDAEFAAVKAILDPFTGCFVSRLPVTVVLLRFALRVARMIADGREALGVEVATVGAQRIDDALSFTLGGGFAAAIARERGAWHLYYDTLDAFERGLAAEDPVALELRDRAREIIAATRVGGPATSVA